jgi:large subunit ribosomal protein L25
MTIKLTAKLREITGKKVFQLRADDKIPAVLYGSGVENKNLVFDYNTFEKVYKEAGESTIVDLEIEGGETVKVLITEIVYEPVKHVFSHVDLKAVNMKEKITANVEFKFLGESPAIKEGGILVQNLNEVEIRCLPTELIHGIEVDLTTLEKVGDTISFKDLVIPEAVEIIGHEDNDVVATITLPKIEKAVEAAEAKEEGVEGEAGESADGEKKEGNGGEDKKEEKK